MNPFRGFVATTHWHSYITQEINSAWKIISGLQMDPQCKPTFEQWQGIALELSNKGLDDSQIVPLGIALKENPDLKVFHIDLSKNSCGDDGAIAIAESLKVQKWLAQPGPNKWPQNTGALNFSNNKISKVGLQAIFSAIRQTERGAWCLYNYPQEMITDKEWEDLAKDPTITELNHELDAFRSAWTWK